MAVQGLGFLETGITDQLNHFSNTLLEYSSMLRHVVGDLKKFCGTITGLRDLPQTRNGTDPFLTHIHSLLLYSHTNRAIIKLRDQKQMDFEGLSVYLSNATNERDRLSAVISGHAGSTGLGIGSYLREKVDALRGADDDRTRVERMRKLDAKIKEVRLQVSVKSNTLMLWK